MNEYTMQLAPGTTLQGGKYRIECVLGQGGFGITYLAVQDLLGRQVAIKEFFMRDFCSRSEQTSEVTLGTNPDNKEMMERYLAKFLKEARTISQLNQSHIIRIYDIFRENGTAYYVMEYIEGTSLSGLVKERGALPEEEAVQYIRAVAEALAYVHQRSINHLDVKPGNIMLRRADRQVFLLDFGLSKQYDADGNQTSSTPVGISHGYAPIEQYTPGGVKSFSPQTDIYALGATLYYLVTGSTPPNASELFNTTLIGLPDNLSDEVRETIRQAMQPQQANRPKNVEEFLRLLDKKADPTEETQSSSTETAEQQVVQEADSPNRPSPYRKILIGLLLAIVACFGIYYLTTDRNKTSVDETPILPDSVQLSADSVRVPTDRVHIFATTSEESTNNETLAPAHNETPIPNPSNHISSATDNGTNNVEEIYAKAEKAYNEQSYETASTLYQEAAEQGHVESQYKLGRMYYNGRGVTKDKKEAAEWYRKAAEQGHPQAQCNLGYMYANGEGVTEDRKKAVEWYRKAAEQGYARGQYNLGVMYANGQGVTIDFGKAVEWYRKAAEQGYARAQLDLGIWYEFGKGVTQDDEKAAEWYRKAAEQGHPQAQCSLGRMYANGTGVTQDDEKAVEWYRKAAEQGIAKAQYNLGRMYESGRGVTKNTEKAVEWYRKAAKLEYPLAQIKLDTLGIKWK